MSFTSFLRVAMLGLMLVGVAGCQSTRSGKAADATGAAEATGNGGSY